MRSFGRMRGAFPQQPLDLLTRLCEHLVPSRPLARDLEAWMRAERARLSRHSDVAKAMDYMLKRWPAFERFLDDGRICLTNNAAERALRGIALVPISSKA